MGGPRTEQGFTLLELMVVVLIIGILAAIAIPVYVGLSGNSQRRACFATERIIEGAYRDWESEAATAAARPSDWPALMTALVPSYLATEPVCPVESSYVWSSDDTVRCTTHGSYHD